MKELSIKEKAKAYDEALEKARCYYKGANGNEDMITMVTTMFPSLKESEGEDIKQFLIDFIKVCGWTEKKDQGWPSKEKCITWLEKQGEQKFADGTFVNVDDVREDFVNEVYRVLDADSTNERANQIIDAFDNLPTVTIEKQSGQEPAWSEEDEEIHRKCICVMRASACGFPEEEDFVEQVNDWLKSIKDRVQPQSKQEWSEEDEKHIHSIISTIECNRETYKQSKVITDSYTSDLEWFKSLINRCKLSDDFSH